MKRFALPLIVFAAALLPAWNTLAAWFALGGEKLLRVDYSLYVASALQGVKYGWHHLYDLEAQRKTFSALAPLWWFPNVYTPALSVAMLPFTRLSLDSGYAVWRLVLLACMLLSWHLLAPGNWAARLAQLPLLFVPHPVRYALWLGQILAVQVAAVALCAALLERNRDRAAGVLLAATVALKPQGLMLVPFALLAAGRTRAFAAWAMASAVIGFALLALIGFDGAHAYAGRLAYAQSHLQEFAVAWSCSLARRIDSPLLFRFVELVAVALTLVAAARQRNPDFALCAGLCGSLVAAPFIHLDDYLLLVPALWLLVRAWPSLLTMLAAAACWLSMLPSADAGIGGRWVLLFACIVLPLLAALPPHGAMRKLLADA